MHSKTTASQFMAHESKKISFSAFSALTLLVGRQEGHPACKKTEWWCAGMVICLELGADLHMAQLMPLPLTVSCFSKIQIGFTFLVLAHLGNPRQRAVKRVCVCVCVKAKKNRKVNEKKLKPKTDMLVRNSNIKTLWSQSWGREEH